MSAPLIVDNKAINVYAIKQVRKGRALTFMACSRGPHGKCSRCGTTHSRSRIGSAGRPPRVSPREKAIVEARRRQKAHQARLDDYKAESLGR